MLFNTRQVDCFQLISVPVTAFSRKFLFPDLPELRNVTTTAIVHYPYYVMRTDNFGVPTSTNAITQAFVTFMEGSREFLKQVDIQLFNPFMTNITYGNRSGIMPLQPKRIDFSQSYIELSQDVAALPGTPFVFLFGIYYTKRLMN